MSSLLNASRGSERTATPSVRSASPASSSLSARICARRAGVERLLLFADQFLRAAREQHVRRAFGEDEQTRLAARRRV